MNGHQLIRVGQAVAAVGAVSLVIGGIGLVTGGGKQPVAASSTTTPADAATPPASATPSATASTPTSPPAAESPPASATSTPEPESVDAFMVVFNEALADDDLDTLMARLHPKVLDVFSEDACRDRLTTVLTGTAPQFTPTAVTGPASWTWVIDGRSVPIEDALTVTIQPDDGEADGATQEAHYAYVDGTLRWFTDCGTPRP